MASRKTFPRRFPRRGEIYICGFETGLEKLAVVVSCDEANSVRSVVEVCEVAAHHPEWDSLPTVVHVPALELGLEEDKDILASTYVLPQGALIRHEGHLSLPRLRALEIAIRRVFGWEPWPIG